MDPQDRQIDACKLCLRPRIGHTLDFAGTGELHYQDNLGLLGDCCDLNNPQAANLELLGDAIGRKRKERAAPAFQNHLIVGNELRGVGQKRRRRSGKTAQGEIGLSRSGCAADQCSFAKYGNGSGMDALNCAGQD